MHRQWLEPRLAICWHEFRDCLRCRVTGRVRKACKVEYVGKIVQPSIKHA